MQIEVDVDVDVDGWRRCRVSWKTKGDTKVPRGTLYINIENAMACVSPVHTHTHTHTHIRTHT